MKILGAKTVFLYNTFFTQNRKKIFLILGLTIILNGCIYLLVIWSIERISRNINRTADKEAARPIMKILETEFRKIISWFEEILRKVEKTLGVSTGKDFLVLFNRIL